MTHSEPSPLEDWKQREAEKLAERKAATQKPKNDNMKIERLCLKCRKKFLATDRYNFMCKRDTKGNDSNSWDEGAYAKKRKASEKK